MGKILILGAAGFMGSNFVNWLLIQPNSRLEIVGVDNISTFSTTWNVEPFILCKRFRLHISNIVDRETIKRIIEIERPNIVLNTVKALGPDFTNFLADSCKEIGVEKLITIASADTILADNEFNINIIFDALYGIRQHISREIPSFIFKAIHNIPIDLNAIAPYYKNWLYINDAFAAFLRVLSDGICGSTYSTIAFSPRFSNVELCEKIFKTTRAPFIPCTMAHQQENNYTNHLTSNTEFLDWRPKYELDAALEHTVAWYSLHPKALEK